MYRWRVSNRTDNSYMRFDSIVPIISFSEEEDSYSLTMKIEHLFGYEDEAKAYVEEVLNVLSELGLTSLEEWQTAYCIDEYPEEEE